MQTWANRKLLESEKKQPATSADPSRTGSVFTVLGCTVDACTRCKSDLEVISEWSRSDLEVISKWHIGFLDQVDKLQAGWCLWSPFPQTILLKRLQDCCKTLQFGIYFLATSSMVHTVWRLYFDHDIRGWHKVMQSKVCITPYKNLQTKLTRKSIGQINTRHKMGKFNGSSIGKVFGLRNLKQLGVRLPARQLPLRLAELCRIDWSLYNHIEHGQFSDNPMLLTLLKALKIILDSVLLSGSHTIPIRRILVDFEFLCS